MNRLRHTNETVEQALYRFRREWKRNSVARMRIITGVAHVYRMSTHEDKNRIAGMLHAHGLVAAFHPYL